MIDLGKILIGIGLTLVILGGLLISGLRLPGDIFFQRGNFTFYFPIVTSIIISIILTIVFNLFRK